MHTIVKRSTRFCTRISMDSLPQQRQRPLDTLIDYLSITAVLHSPRSPAMLVDPLPECSLHSRLVAQLLAFL